MARNVVVEGVIIRVIDSREVRIPFLIDGEGNDGSGLYRQWGGHGDSILGQNVDLLEGLRDAVLDAE
jgi:hypothetical protein